MSNFLKRFFMSKIVSTNDQDYYKSQAQSVSKDPDPVL